MTLEMLSALVGVVTSLIFSYFPGVSDWFAALESNVKRLLQLAVAFVVTGAIFGLGCAGIVDSGFACDWTGALDAVSLLISFLIANQTAFSLTPKAKK